MHSKSLLSRRPFVMVQSGNPILSFVWQANPAVQLLANWGVITRRRPEVLDDWRALVQGRPSESGDQPR